jgi:hypothetical protein
VVQAASDARLSSTAAGSPPGPLSVRLCWPVARMALGPHDQPGDVELAFDLTLDPHASPARGRLESVRWLGADAAGLPALPAGAPGELTVCELDAHGLLHVELPGLLCATLRPSGRPGLDSNSPALLYARSPLLERMARAGGADRPRV